MVNANGENALHYACLHNASVEVFELLVGRRADKDFTEKILGGTITVIIEWIQMQSEGVWRQEWRWRGAVSIGVRVEDSQRYVCS